MAGPDDELGAAETILREDTLSTTGPGTGEESPTSAIPSLIANRYAILGLLGAGGMGLVYRAHDRTLDEIVALKILRRESGASLDRFRQEVKLARLVTSPHVVRTFDVGDHEGGHFLTMELIEGRSLARVLDEGPPPFDDVLRISRAACAGIAAAHAAGVLHRDLKPDNILVGNAGRIAITDFGIARMSSDLADNALAGTPSYMAPEQLTQQPIGPPADVFAFGAILYEMLAGRRAYSTFERHGDPPDPRTHRNVPAQLAELVVRCLARAPDRRLADGAALVAALSKIDISNAPTMELHDQPAIPLKSARTIAVLPLRAPPELAEIAEGLAEEIVDTLSMTRELRVRPLVAARAAHRPDADPAATGRALGVDVVVEGSLRRTGDIVRITARAIGVADGFQLWASKIETPAEQILAAADKVAELVAHALAVEIDAPARPNVDPRAVELYLEAKAKLRSGWMHGAAIEAMELLERALAIAPNDANICAAMSMALSRSAFIGRGAFLPRAKQLAERAVSVAPLDGDAWCALAIANLYDGQIAAAGAALRRAVEQAPGLALAQAMLGALLLEAGAYEDALAHLEGARSLDPGHALGMSDLARAYFFGGRIDECFALLESTRDVSAYLPLTIGRFRVWNGETYDGTSEGAQMPAEFAKNTQLSIVFMRHRRFTADELAEYLTTIATPNPRLMAARAQLTAELLCIQGEYAMALDQIATAIANGFHDYYWFVKCPVLAPLRADPRFVGYSAIVEGRAKAVIAAIMAAT